MGPLFYVSSGDWGSGLARPLHDFEFDGNNWTIQQAIEAIEASVVAVSGKTVESISNVGAVVTITYSDTSTDILTFPSASVNFTGAYAAGDYSIGDFFTALGRLYVVNVDHTAPTDFDPGLGVSGNDYYSEVLRFPAVPVVTQTGATMTLATTDANTYNRMTNAAGCAITFPDVDFPADTEIHFRQCGGTGAGSALTFVAANSNVNVEPPESLGAATALKGAVVTAKYAGIISSKKQWDIFGLLRAA